ncbi:HAMP domain-containing histidine kinase [Parasulfuritortus cantonensis]|uniref:histidine kinase n=1 Tax=Parasulfuritortus cantonensis TaxID=2528202 RepID=A0A4V2NW79_9PROT|nr:HAMP domain-containing sensor histidine kinase [Parasulfuritortus cantonensis]TCJ16282.1 HAMP domain-containing histidine kinase [Parasulfuritortus cantonensis]
MEPDIPPLDDQQLREAFKLFSETSERLSGAYAELQGQVARLSAELAAANGELARRERLSILGEVAAKLAHQLRTPLATALLYVGHLARPGLAEADRVRFADKTLGRLRYLERLIQDMLAFVKGQQGRRTLFAVHALADEVWQAIEPQAATLEVAVQLHREGDDERIEADRQALQGALINLLENAVQASRPGDTVTFTVVTGTAFVAFRVADQGHGIAEADRERLFEPFFTTRGEGSGLGLAIVKQTADAHGGWVEVESEPGQGSRFALFLPVAGRADAKGGQDA